jgi:hypothetical protein
LRGVAGCPRRRLVYAHKPAACRRLSQRGAPVRGGRVACGRRASAADAARSIAGRQRPSDDDKFIVHPCSVDRELAGLGAIYAHKPVASPIPCPPHEITVDLASARGLGPRPSNLAIHGTLPADRDCLRAGCDFMRINRSTPTRGHPGEACAGRGQAHRPSVPSPCAGKLQPCSHAPRYKPSRGARNPRHQQDPPPCREDSVTSHTLHSTSHAHPRRACWSTEPQIPLCA